MEIFFYSDGKFYFYLNTHSDMKIITYRIQISMGELTPFMDKLDFLTPEQKSEFNLIGYTGKNPAGEKTNWTQLLNSLAPGKE